ncbi:unnamed protein product [Caenorhabditis bovis]|uniref:UBC core domain-containing protein n=1 Tax=Caenorhabditis bovis TaxID=2654633 RepID=A0A8S1EYT8_9PELO|nr:unnamed protein product [Caenorhabditis bovis]
MATTRSAAAHSRVVQLIRVRKEVEDLTKNRRVYIKDFAKALETRDVFMFKIHGDGDVYKGAIISITIDISLEYPFKVPVVTFDDHMYHPNVDAPTGELCSPLLMQENWKPETTMEDILINTLCILNEPDLSRPVNFDAAHDYMTNRAQYVRKCKECIKKFR